MKQTPLLNTNLLHPNRLARIVAFLYGGLKFIIRLSNFCNFIVRPIFRGQLFIRAFVPRRIDSHSLSGMNKPNIILAKSEISNSKMRNIILIALLVMAFSVSAFAAPAANAGSDMTVMVGEAVRLDGSASTGY